MSAPRRILITGAAGFVGRHVQRKLVRLLAPDDVVLATSLEQQAVTGATNFQYETMNVLDSDAVKRTVEAFCPTHIFHLAGVAASEEALRLPSTAWHVNVTGTVLVASAAAKYAPNGIFYFVSSAEVYGKSFNRGIVVDENTPVAPMTPYARTKAAAEQAVLDITPRDGQVVILRPFNHTGPGQDERFVVPAFAAQIAQLEKNDCAGKMLVGNLNAERDFLDVRDVARAYALLIVESTRLPKRAVLNVASSIPRKIENILNDLLARASCSISVQTDPSRYRTQEIPYAVGVSHAIQDLIGWQPQIPWPETLDAVLADQRVRVQGGTGRV